MNLSDRFLAGFLVAWNLLIVFFFLAHLMGWFWMWIAIEAVVGLAEFTSYQLTGRTVTQKFRAWGGRHPLQAYGLLGLMLGAWVLLLLHLGVR